MIASLLMRHKSREVNVDNKEVSGRCPHVALMVVMSCFGRWKNRRYPKFGYYVTKFPFLFLKCYWRLYGTTGKLYKKKKITINHPAVTFSSEDVERLNKSVHTTITVSPKKREIKAQAFRFYSGVKSVEIPGKVELIARRLSRVAPDSKVLSSRRRESISATAHSRTVPL
jgi:hypothetical protein